MLIFEIRSIFLSKKAESQANLAKAERIEKAMNAVRLDSSSARKAAQIFRVSLSSSTRRLNGETSS